MKALTNILNYILLLMMILIASCTEDTAEVDNLVRGEEYVTVRMQVPGMKNATTRADEAEDNLTSVVVLVFRNDALVSKTEVTTASSTLTTTTSTTGTFNIPRPQSGDIIHFLGNLPESVKNSLPATGGTQEEVLCALTTKDDKNLSYWGKATYNGDDITVTLYRNMAKIEIAAGDECTFPKDQLFIVGLVNANQVGALVPCNEEGTFGYRDKPTLPESPSPKTDEDAQPLVTSLYVFEHENPGTANGLYVICKIEDDYYKVALIDEDKEPYPIIRNHRYVIYVNDLDYGADDFDIAASPETKPCNFAKVTFTNTSDKTLYWNDGSPTSFDVEMTGVPDGKEVTLSITGAEAFTITLPNGDAVSDTYTGGNTTFTIKPKDENSVSDDAYTIGFSGTGNGVNVVSAEVNVTVKASSSALIATSGTINMDEGATETILTLTKPADVQNIRFNITDANDKFEVKVNGNTLQFDNNNNYFEIQNNSNEYVEITFKAQNNVETGAYEVRFWDANNQETVTSGIITVTNTKPAVTEVVIWPTTSDSSPINVNNGYSLYTQDNKSYIVAGATLKVEFEYNITDSWQTNNLYLSLKTNWSKVFASCSYVEGNSGGTLTYTFDGNDFGGPGGTDDITNAGLYLYGSYVTITKISITSAK